MTELSYADIRIGGMYLIEYKLYSTDDIITDVYKVIRKSALGIMCKTSKDSSGDFGMFKSGILSIKEVPEVLKAVF